MARKKKQTDIIDAEFVEEVSGLPAVREKKKADEDDEIEEIRKSKHPRLTLHSTEYYKRKVNKLLKLPTDQYIAYIQETLDTQLILAQETSLRLLEDINNNVPYAVEKYEALQAAIAMKIKAKNELMEIVRPLLPQEKNKQYKAPDISNDEWEKQFKPQVDQVVAEKKKKDPEIFTGKAPKSVN